MKLMELEMVQKMAAGTIEGNGVTVTGGEVEQADTL